MKVANNCYSSDFYTELAKLNSTSGDKILPLQLNKITFPKCHHN